MSNELIHPWQNEPSKIIDFALSLLLENTDFARRVSFLLFDLGIEITIKAYLTLPESESGSKLSFSKSKLAIESENFHGIIDAIKIAAKERVKGINFSHIEHYHKIRNTLYHTGLTTIRIEDSFEYANLAVKLLNRLLNVDLSEKFEQPKIAIREKEIKTELINDIKSIRNKLADYNLILMSIAERVVESFNPNLLLPSFKRSFTESKNNINRFVENKGPINLTTEDEGQIFEIIKQHQSYPNEFLPQEIFRLDGINQKRIIEIFNQTDSIKFFILRLADFWLSRKQLNLVNSSDFYDYFTGIYIQNLKFIDDKDIPLSEPIVEISKSLLKNIINTGNRLITKSDQMIKQSVY
jgi:hypothetical protein